MKVISFNDIISCNKYLEEQNIKFKVHIRDACGRQSFWIESLSEVGTEHEYMDMQRVLEEYFLKLGTVIVYDEDKIDFWIDQKAN